jgi:ethanolamine ammonia-lyase small subunit
MSDAWKDLRKFTQARVGLKRSAAAIETKELLDFQLAHAMARDAVHQPWEFNKLGSALRADGQDFQIVNSQIRTREEFLKRPDLGRMLSPVHALKKSDAEIAFIISDGLSAAAIDGHFLSFWKILKPKLSIYKITPLILAPFSRVALSNEIGAALGVKLIVMIIGERPGLTSTDSMGIYLTYDPKPGRHDADRNCISNIRPPHGLSYEGAAEQLQHLIAISIQQQLSGVGLAQEPHHNYVTGSPKIR